MYLDVLNLKRLVTRSLPKSICCHIGDYIYEFQYEGRKSRVAMILTLSSLLAPDIVIITTAGTASYDKIDIMTTPGFQLMLYIQVI